MQVPFAHPSNITTGVRVPSQVNISKWDPFLRNRTQDITEIFLRQLQTSLTLNLQWLQKKVRTKRVCIWHTRMHSKRRQYCFPSVQQNFFLGQRYFPANFSFKLKYDQHFFLMDTDAKYSGENLRFRSLKHLSKELCFGGILALCNGSNAKILVIGMNGVRKR